MAGRDGCAADAKKDGNGIGGFASCLRSITHISGWWGPAGGPLSGFMAFFGGNISVRYSQVTSALFDGLIKAGLVPHLNSIPEYQELADRMEVAYYSALTQ